MLTQGNRGLSFKQRNKKILWLPPAATNLKDTIGAGDAAVSFASCFIRNSKNEKLISIVAALAAAIKVGIIGLGYVGLPICERFSRAGVEVIGIDSDSFSFPKFFLIFFFSVKDNCIYTTILIIKLTSN